jgi:hypothetical protein
MKKAARPFRLVGNSMLQALRQRLEAGLSAWATDWEIDLLTTTVDATDTLPSQAILQAETWKTCRSTSGANVWFRSSDDQARKLHTLIFGIEKPDDLSWQVVAKVQADLVNACHRALCGDTPPASYRKDTPADDLYAPGAGTVLFQFEALDLMILAEGSLLPTAKISPTQSKAPKVPDLRQFVGDQPISLNVLAGSADLKLSHLLSLRRGDVIRLDSKLDDSLTLAIGPKHQRLAACALGQSEGHCAIQIV